MLNHPTIKFFILTFFMFSFNLKSAFSFLILATTSATLLPISGVAMGNYAMAKTVSTGDLVRINTYTTLNLRNAPCGNVIGNIAPMSTGRVAASEHNTHKMSCNGGNWTWVKVDFANVSGFVAAEYLLKLDNTLMKKEMPKDECKMMLLNGICYNSDGTRYMELKFSCADGFIADVKTNSCYKELEKYVAPKKGEKVEPAKMPEPKMMSNSVWMTGSKVSVDTAMVPVQVRATPCGNRIALASPRAVGTLMNNQNNFVKATCNGGTFSWLDVDFGNGVRGWVAREYLKSSVNV